MLERLEVTNYVLIRSLVMDFSSGFTVISGETGSGKSIILGALGLILGEKAKSDIVRQGEKESRITALFSYRPSGPVAAFLKENGLEGEEESLIIQRIVRSSGRSIMTVNGISVAREILESLGRLLVDVSGQHSHHSLLHKSVQLSLLDKAAGNSSLLASYREAYEECLRLSKRQKELIEENDRAGAEADYISFCLAEIDKADVRPGEDEELADQLKRISQSAELKEEVDETVSAIRGGMETGALSTLSRALSSLERAARIDSGLEEYARRLESSVIEIEDISSSLGSYQASLDVSESELDAMNGRLALLQRLKKKYGGSLEEVIRHREEFRSRTEAIENFDSLLEENRKQLESCRTARDRAAAKLSESRKKCASRLSPLIEGKLRQLGLAGASFTIELSETEASASGTDSCVFTLSANKGEKAGPISQIASGGELSRIMLAIKAALSREDDIETLLFDEIDTGIGGNVANSVAGELEKLASTHQVIAITHLAQIASRAENHFLVSKAEEGQRTVSTIRELDRDERVNEIARLLSGQVNEISLNHARSLLK